jgi:cytochrome P450 family 6
VIFVYFKILNAYGYWKKRDVPFIPPVPLFGSIFGIFLGMESISTMQVKNYNTFKGHRYFGIYVMTRPHLVIRDPKLIYRVLVKDFSSFQDRGIGLNSKINPLVENVLHSDGEQWKRLRSKLSSTFNPGKLTIMFPHMIECGEHIVHILKQYDKSGTSIDAQDFFTLYVTNIIGTCVYGFDSQTMNYPDSEFHKMCRKAHTPSWRTKIGVVYRLLIPDLMKYFKFKSFSRGVENYFLNLVKNCVRTRENEGIFREDFIQLLMELRSQAIESSKKDPHGRIAIPIIFLFQFINLMSN